MDQKDLRIEQSSFLPPAQPTYVLRGHSAQVHAVHFFRSNLRLLSGDADGWVICWDMAIKRSAIVWRPHTEPILGLASWDNDKIITHGRDNKLFVWQLKQEDEKDFSTILPIEDATTARKQPWLLHSLDVNALNFCSFATCLKNHKAPNGAQDRLIATPGVKDGYVNVTSLPDEDRVATIPPSADVNTGMVMAIGICFQQSQLIVLAGYESGHAAIWRQDDVSKKWQLSSIHKFHTQPVLSIGLTPDLNHFFTSSADAIIVRYAISGLESPSTKTIQTKHAGQQSLEVRGDSKIFATAGWDGRLRVYATKSMKELAVLKWHKDGCYALTFAKGTNSTAESQHATEADHAVLARELTVSERRSAQAKSTHWIAAGSKDGKISLWDIY